MKIFSVHISSLISHIATAMLLLRVKIWPRKCHSNLTQLIIFRLLRGCSPPRSELLRYQRVRCSINDGIRSVQRKALPFWVAESLRVIHFLARPFCESRQSHGSPCPSTAKSSSLRNQRSTQPVFSNPQQITCIIFENLFGPYFLPHQSHNYGYAPSSGENLTSKI